MNCEDFESNVNDLAREQLLEASVRAGALAHRDECAACARRLNEERALSFELRALANQTTTIPVPAPGNDLFTALRKSHAPIRATAARSWPYWATAGAALAAMVLLVIAVMVMRSRSIASQTVQEVSNTPNARPEKSIAPTPQVVVDSNPTQTSPDGLTANRRTRGQRRHLKQQSTNPVATHKDIAAEIATSDADPATEITTEFMPIGYATETSIQDGGQLVRVELPRSALIAFGLPMNVNRYDERVKADVFFGADGLARAIRFVQ